MALMRDLILWRRMHLLGLRRLRLRNWSVVLRRVWRPNWLQWDTIVS